MKERNDLEDLDADGRMILKYMLNRMGRHGLIWLRIAGQVVTFCEHENDSSGCIKGT